jgi:hypothetical protein
VSDKVLAQAILDISTSMKKLSSSGLNRRAVIALINDDLQRSVSKGTIETVLRSLQTLAENYTEK